MDTVASCLQWAEHVLASATEELEASSKTDSQWLLAFVLEKNSTWLRTWPEHKMESGEVEKYQQCIERRKAGEPVAYITGRQGFWTLDLDVNKHTLVPRPDTELIVELSLSLFDEKPIAVADLGTGTGAIALALKSERPGWDIVAIDVSENALLVAKRNAQRFLLSVEFVQSSWFQALEQRRFQLVVSNPPYIESDDKHLAGVGVRFEPVSALASGLDGLDDIRKIICSAPEHLLEGGWLLLEHGYNQGDVVRQLLGNSGFENVRTEKDFGDNDRVSMGQWLTNKRLGDVN